MKQKKIPGFNTKTPRNLENEKTVANLCDKLGKTVPQVMVSPEKVNNCQGGNIDACQNASWCAKCMFPEREGEEVGEKFVFGQTEVIEPKTYFEDPLSRGYIR